MKFIGFGKLSRYLFFPLCTPILSCLFVTVSQSFIREDPDSMYNKEKSHDHPIVLSFCFFLSQTFAGFLELASILLNRRRKATSEMAFHTESTKIFCVDAVQEAKKKGDWVMYLIIFGLTFVEGAGLFIGAFLFLNEQDVLFSQLIALQMVFSGIFSYFILHYKIHRHQLVAVALFLFGIASIATRTIENTPGMYIGAVFIGVVLWSFQSVVAKWLMEKYFITQFRYLFLHGLFGAIVCFTVMLFSPYVPCKKGLFCNTGVLEPSWETLSWMFSSKLALNFVGLVVIVCAYNTFQLTTIKLFDPTHNDASESLGSLISWIYIDFIQDTHKVEFILSAQIIGYIFMIMASLMYNEIIIVHVLNLGFNTKVEIARRSEEEANCDKDVSLIETPCVELIN